MNGMLRASCIVAVIVAAGCSGGVKSISSSPGGSIGTSALIRTTVTISVAAGSGAQSVRPKYVSPSTLGVAITIYGALATPPPGPTTVANLSAGSSLCTSNPDGSRTCTVSVLAPIGNDNFIVTTYDQPPSGTTPQGNILSTTTLQYVIVAGQTNTVPLTLNGVPATIVLSPPGFLVPPSQTNTFTFNVNAKDAGGNYIIGPGNYTQPITFVIANDPNHTISLSTTSITSPATTSVTGTYTGGSLPGIATITGSATGAVSGTTTVQSSSAVTQVTVVVPPPTTTAAQMQTVYPQGGYWAIPGVGGYSGSMQYSTNSAAPGTTASITATTSAPGVLPNPQPPGTALLYVQLSLSNATTFTQGIQSLTVTLPSTISTVGRTFYESVYDLTTGTYLVPAFNNAVAGAGVQTLTFGPGAVQNPITTTFPANENYLVVISSVPSQSLYISLWDSNRIYVYGPGANGAVAPDFSYPVVSGPEAIAFDSSGTGWVAGGYPSQVLGYAGASFGSPPTTGISGASTGLAQTYFIMFDGAGNLYASNTAASSPSIEVFAPGASGNAAPIRTISGSATGLTLPYAMALDAAGNLYVSNFNASATTGFPVEVFAPGANGNVAPIRTLAGSNTGLSGSRGLAFDPNGNLFVATVDSNLNGIIQVFAPGASGNVAPLYTIAGSNTSLVRPKGIAFDSAGELYVANLNQSSTTFLITVFAAGASGNVAPIRTITGPATGGVGPLYPAFAPLRVVP